VLKCEGRMEELLKVSPDTLCDLILRTFLQARMGEISEDGVRENALPCTILQERRVQLLGKMGRFRDQGQLMCELAGLFEFAGEPQQAVKCFNRARNVGEAHGFFSIECRACKGLGQLAMKEGRCQDAVDLLQNALAAVPLIEVEDSTRQLDILELLIDALYLTDAIDDVEPLVPRFRKAAKEEARKTGGFCFFELTSFVISARFHEARGKSRDAAREVRALLNLLRRHEAEVQMHPVVRACEESLRVAATNLKILDPAHGEEELIAEMASELAKLRAHIGPV